MAKTNIAWCTHSLNWIKWFCTKASPGCQHCYMLELAKRYPAGWADRPTWRDNAMKDYRAIPSGAEVFVGDMYDVFHEQMPLRYIHWHFNAAIARPDVTWLFLTKRIERAFYLAPYLALAPNVWLGTSVENADYAWRIDYLRRIPIARKFISFEPLIGSVGDVSLKGIDGVITGAESGGNRRPFDPVWASEILALAKRDGAAFFHKQGSHFKPGMNRELYGVIHDDLAWRTKVSGVPNAPVPSQMEMF